MAESEVAIVNSALVKIGEGPITSLTQDTEAARAANRQYSIKRDELIRSYRWNFAIKRADLALDTETPAFGFDHQFRLPTDCLRVIGVFDERERLVNYTGTRLEWKMEIANINGENEPRLLATETVTKIFYLARIENTSLFDSQFSEALALRLALDLGYALSTGTRRNAELRQEFTEVIRQAKLSDAIEGKPEVIEASDWIDSRFEDPFIYSRIGPIN
ncbi:MAG: hypothetical protein ACR2PR_08730, partial [Pseudohongiellaceae bacterium]